LEAILLIFGVLEDLDIFKLIIGDQLLVEPDIAGLSLRNKDPYLLQVLNSLAVLNIL
jgi:hypothetical protein